MSVAMPEAMDKAENILKDAACEYMILMTDGTHVYLKNSGRISALGLARYAAMIIEKDLVADSEEAV